MYVIDWIVVVFSFLFSDFLICFFLSSSSSSTSSLFLLLSSFFFNRFFMFGRPLHARRGFYQVHQMSARFFSRKNWANQLHTM
jgi:hypothetical protein